ncbi:MAG: hypothetical protein HKN67_11965, partial [Saprospiraceae bacterium]|nr:hypothetical protein [Saprospiraceae bacterium]
MYYPGKLLILITMLGSWFTGNAQNCELPVVTYFSNPTINGFDIEWIDFNSNPNYFEIEIGKRGFERRFRPDYSFIPGTTYTFNDLESGSSYELYIRTVCSSLDTSLWNGPYFYNTVIDNKTSCGLSLAIEDNSCPGGQPFLIYVDGFEDKKMGQDLVIDKLDMVIAHPWPPDLLIQLESPQGNIVDLSRFNGNGTDDYGNSRDSLCMGTASFTDNACISVEDFIPPFSGSFRPETALSNLYTGSSPDGIWKLLICDQASDDIGILKSVKLNFSEEACIIPSGFTIVDIESDNATLIWNQQNNCQNLNLTYKIKGDPVSEAIQDFVECKAGEFTVIDLLPNTSYELIVTAQCSADSNSPESCLIEFQTSCKNYNHLESFDQYGVCDSICNSKCDIPGLWSNDPMNSSDWLLGKGETLTGFTGPDGDINITGNYVYIENQPAFCSGSQDIILVSSCLSYDMSIPCSVSFYYNMYGEETGDLYLEYTTDSIFWSKLWEKSGNQGPGWKFQTVEIPVSFEYGRLRFRALKKKNALRGDIAIDHIKLIGPDTVSMKKYFIDADNDGYGNPDIQIFSCTSTPPIGYVENQDDCDDNNSQINPSAIEIECNGIDENCNGLMDDPSVNDIDYVLVNKSNESCNGLSDGTIEIMATNGSEPYNYIWSNGISGSEISGLPAGVYYCTISDFNGCVSVTDSLTIESENVMTYSIPMIAHPSCAGVRDGSVQISVDGGTEPYVVLWDDGIEGIERTDLSDGTYFPTITDSNGCELVMQEVVLAGQTALST